MTEIKYYFSLTSPFTYLAGLELEEIAERHGANVSYRPADIRKVFAATGGLAPGDRHISRQIYRKQEIERIAKMRGMKVNVNPKFWPCNALPASTAVIAIAETGGNPGKVAFAFERACWAEERNIEDPQVIFDVLKDNGFDLAALAAKMSEAEAIFDKNTKQALEDGCFGAPFYIVDDQRFWGQDRLVYLDAYLKDR